MSAALHTGMQMSQNTNVHMLMRLSRPAPRVREGCCARSAPPRDAGPWALPGDFRVVTRGTRKDGPAADRPTTMPAPCWARGQSRPRKPPPLSAGSPRRSRVSGQRCAPRSGGAVTSAHRESSPRQAAPRASAPPLFASAGPWVSGGGPGLPTSAAIRPLRHRIRPGPPPGGKRGLPPAFAVRHRGRLR